MIPHHVAILSFEGPDRYASIGGLATRVTQLARALGAAGHDVQLFFVGDPHAAAIEPSDPGVTLRRWSQWVSAQHPRNAYDGEAGKIHDWETSLPAWIVDEIAVPAATAGERVLVICEEWQTANVAIAIDRLARERGVRPAITLMWNANNTYGFEKIHWPTLTRAAAITCVSKYMKFELARWHVQALVIPNGIDRDLLDGADREQTAALRDAFGGRPTCVKVGRFDPDKNWLQAIDALADLHAGGLPPGSSYVAGKNPTVTSCWAARANASCASSGLRTKAAIGASSCGCSRSSMRRSCTCAPFSTKRRSMRSMPPPTRCSPTAAKSRSVWSAWK